ncbi:Arc family DNA binding domain-containing protein [Pedobacter gandavensis]|uniref:Arc family DNA binding domain-containing protein n=1 Tax=Pedobacter TaxID=84567 RepID=UPI001C9A220C|nr:MULTISPECIES: Arc family DNA binding domain-containing protein [Pedobacter]WGQ11580.1 Arc family DNA binding domain-containing protein [Pedobacter gandavensis]
MSEKDKKAFALRISPALLKEIENWANDEFRSINGQIEYLLNEAVKSKRKRRINKNDTDEPR